MVLTVLREARYIGKQKFPAATQLQKAFQKKTFDILIFIGKT